MSSNKLVRDKIPEVIRKNGQTCQFKYLDQSACRVALRAKLEEELYEYFKAGNNAEAIEELSDILEIIRSLSEIHGKGFKDVEKKRQQKFTERGGFNDKIYLIDVDDK